MLQFKSTESLFLKELGPDNASEKPYLKLGFLLSALLLNYLVLTASLSAQNTQPVVVSATSYDAKVAPGSIATVFGGNLATGIEAARLDAAGNLPKSLLGTSITIGTVAADLIYVSPTQINFVIPSNLPTGLTSFSIKSAASPTELTGSLNIALTAPGIFTIPCLRLDRAAVLNAVTYELEPFATVTPANGPTDQRTRLSIFATGLRYAGNPTRNPATVNVGDAVQVEAVDSKGRSTKLPVEYAGPAPNFFGLDQLNVILPTSLEGAGILRIRIQIQDQSSNWVSLLAAPAPPSATPGAATNYRIVTIAGQNLPGSATDGETALNARLSTPSALTFGPDGSMYIANPGDRTIRRISPNGLITRFAGTGAEGSTGDNGPAAAATFRQPQALAMDRAGQLFIVDAADHRVRVIGRDGIIRPFAGTGQAGFSGDGGPATAAQFQSPSAIVADPYGAVFITDSRNHRIRKVLGDGRIYTFAGTGEAGFSGDGNASYRAQLNNPGSLALQDDGTLFIADNANNRIRSIAPNGTIRTLVGSGVTGSQATTCGPLDAKFQTPLNLAIDRTGTLWIADSGSHRVLRMDQTCQVIPTAGEGSRGFAGDNGPALTALLDNPAGLAADAAGNIYIAVAGSHRIRKLFLNGGCDQAGSLTFNPFDPSPGQVVTGTLTLSCVVAVDTTFNLSANANIIGSLPPVTVLAGQNSATFTFTLSGGNPNQIVEVTANNGRSNIIGNFSVSDLGRSNPITISVSFDRSTLTSGDGATGLVTYSGPPTTAPLLVNLSSNNTGLTLPASVTIPAGETSITFLFLAPIVQQPTQVNVTAQANTLSAQGSVLVNPGTPVGPSTATLNGFTISPSSGASGSTLTGQITLAAPAPNGGVTITLSGGTSVATYPATLTVPAGQLTVSFPINIGVVPNPSTLTLTATSANSLTASAGLSPAGPGTGSILGFSVAPGTVNGGAMAIGTVTLAAAAPANGVLVTLSSSSPSATLPASVTIPAGQTTATFNVGTTAVASATNITLTASSANTVTASLSLNPSGAGSAALGAISLAPASLVGGASSEATVTLAAPAPAGGVLVNLGSNSAAATVPASIVIPAGQTSGTFNVTTSAVANNTSAAITATSANSVNATLTINAPAAGAGTLSGLSLAPTTVTGGTPSTGTVTLGAAAPAGGVLVNLSSNSPNATVPASITIAAGQTTGSFTVTTTAPASQTMATISATSANSVNASLTVNAPSPGQGTIGGLSLSPTSLTGGASSTGTVTLPAPAPAGGVLVNLGSSSASATVPASITIPAGQTSGNFTVNTTTVASQTTATITATSANTVNAALTINAPSAGQGTIGSLSLSPTSLTGGASSTGTVTLAAPAPAGGVLVNLGSSSASATVPASITIPAGQTSGNFTVNTTTVASQTTATITATSANTVNAALTINAPNAGQGTIGSLSLSPTSLTGGASSTGTVTLAAPAPAGGVLVNLGSSSASATVPASITIPAGQASSNFTVNTTTVASQTIASISATSANSVSANLTINAPDPGQGTIGSLSLSPTTVTGGSSSTATVTLSAPASAGGVLVTLGSSSPSATVPASIVIPAGQTTGNFNVTTTTVASLTNASISATSANSVNANLTINPPGAGQGTIGGLSLSPTTLTGGASSNGTVTLSAPAPAGGVLVTLGSSSVSATVPASITIPAGQSTGNFTVNTTTVASQTTASISATSANAVNANLTINAPEPGQGAIGNISLSPTTVTGGSSSTGTVTLSAPAPAGGVLVTLGSGSASATVPASIVIPAGQTSGNFTVNTTTVASQTTAAISATSANSVNANLTINPPAPGQGTIGSLSLSPTTVTGGASSTGTVTLSAPAAAGGVLVTLSSSSGSATVPASIIIAAGQTSGNFTVNTTTVASQTTASISATSANAVNANLTIDPPAPGQGTIGSLSLSPTTVTGSNSSTGTVTLSAPAPAGGVLVTLGSNSGSATVPASIVVAAGQTTGNFTVNTTTVASQTIASISATSANSVNANLTINPPAPVQGTIGSLSLSPTTVTGGSSSTATVTLSAPAPAGGVLVNLASNSASATVPASITIAAGQTSGNFTVNTTTVASQTTASISATSANSVNANLTINPPAPGPGTIGSLNLSPTSVTGGTSSTATVTLSAPAPAGGVLVNLSSNSASATVPASITIAAGQTTGNFSVATTPVSSVTNATITATSANSVNAGLTVNPPCVQGLTLSVNSILGGGSLTGLVTLTGPAPAGGTTVNLAYVGAGVTGPASILIPGGSTTGNFNIGTSPVATLLSAVIQALTGPCGGVNANLDISAPVLNGLVVNPSTINLLGSGTGTVTLSGPAPVGGTVVNLTSNIAANLLGIPNQVTVNAGATTANFTVSNLISLVNSLLQPVTGNVSAALGSVTLNAPITLRILPL